MGHFASYYKSKLSYVWDADFLAFWARTSGTPDTWKVAYNQFFLDLKSANVYDKLDALCLYCGHNESDSRLNIVQNTYNSLAHNSPTFTQKIGFTGNGTSSYLSTGFTPNVGTNKYKLNDASVYVFVENSAAGFYIFGMYGGGGGFTIIPQSGGDEACINSTLDTFSIVGDYIGLVGLSRSASNVVRNRASGYFSNAPTVSTALPTLEYYDLCINFNGSAALFSGNTHSAHIIGSSLTGTQAIDLENAINAFKTNIAAL